MSSWVPLLGCRWPSFLCAPHLTPWQRQEGSSLGSVLIRTRILFLVAPSSWPSYLPKVPPPNAITMGGRIPTYEFKGTQTFSPQQPPLHFSYSPLTPSLCFQPPQLFDFPVSCLWICCSLCLEHKSPIYLHVLLSHGVIQILAQMSPSEALYWLPSPKHPPFILTPLFFKALSWLGIT